MKMCKPKKGKEYEIKRGIGEHEDITDKDMAMDRLCKALLSFSNTIGETRRIYMELLGCEDDMNAVEVK